MQSKYEKWDFSKDGMPDECPACNETGIEYDGWPEMDTDGNHWVTFYCHHCGAVVRFYYQLPGSDFYSRLPVAYVCVLNARGNDR